MNPENSLCFSFVCQPGDLELKALLLGASLRLYNSHWTDDSVELIAALPDESVWGSISDTARELFGELGIKMQSVPSPFGREYPIGNKMSALGVRTSAKTTVFLDSDILCLGRINECVLETDSVKAKPADFDSFSRKQDQWGKIYGAFSLEVPDKNESTTVSRESIRPYYNAGVLAVGDASEFSRIWIDTARSLDKNEDIVNKRPWLDQVAFPVAALRLGRSISKLDETYNYPAHVRILDASNPPVLCHYHRSSVIAEEKLLMETVCKLVARHPLLKLKINAESGWQDVGHMLEYLSKATQIKAGNNNGNVTRNFIITGIPRSGTSLLTRLLNSMENTIVLNEPAEISSLLSDEERAGLNLSLYYRRLRKEILLGRDVMNKVDADGKPVEDTFKQQGDLKPWKPETESADFWLGTKNPLAYLGRLPFICRNYPHIPVIAMIRHPLATLSSWKNSFPHLQQADLDRMPFTNLSDPRLDEFQFARLRAIRAEMVIHRRQALLWAYLAELVWQQRERILVIRYEDLVASPQENLKSITSLLDMKEPDAALAVGIRQDTSVPDLSENEQQEIISICGVMMEKWGYGKQSSLSR